MVLPGTAGEVASLVRMVAAVDVVGLRKRYRRTVAVADVSFTVEEGEIFGLLGPNDSGKTTTVQCLQGLRRPDAGTVRVFGVDVAAHRARVRRMIGSQLQDSALPDRITVWEAPGLFAAICPGARTGSRCCRTGGLSTTVTPRSGTCPAASSRGCSRRWR